MRTNENLHRAKKNKADEFYTLYKDIDKEVSNYKDQFEGKIVYCNCDAPDSNFPTYFYEHFKEYGLKELYATGFNSSGCGSYFHYDGSTLQVRPLTGNGSYDSEECLKILHKDPDNTIVCTNPPFSLLRPYYQTITQSGVDFLIVANANAVTYKQIFPDIKDGKTHIGYNYGHMWFRLPDDAEVYSTNSTRVVDDKDPNYR